MFCFYLSLAALHDDQFLLWGGSGENNLSVVLEDVVELLWGQILQVSAVDDAGLGISGGNAKPLGSLNSFTREEYSGIFKALGSKTSSVPWVDFVDWDVQTCSDVLDSLVALGDDAHALSDGLSCDGMITCYHDDLGKGGHYYTQILPL